jgi:glycosyltransferase involved in cell wall biosynthesis
MSSVPDVSVIVCTHNRAAWLADCVRSILADPSPLEREVIVVDNDSSDDTPNVVREIAAEHPDVLVHYAFEPIRGKSHALNRGVAAASAPLLAFTDDDTLIQPGWLQALLAPFGDPAVGAVGGRIIGQWPQEPPEWLRGPHADYLAATDWGPEPKLHDVAKDEFPVGANMAARADLVNAEDPPFPTELGPGRVRVQFEEYFLGRRIGAGHVIPYAPTAVVFHRVPAERIDWAWMRRSYLQSGVGQARFERLIGRRRDKASFPRRVVRTVRLIAVMVVVRRRNARLAAPGADDASREFGLHSEAGKHLERALGRFPQLTDWIAARLA